MQNTNRQLFGVIIALLGVAFLIDQLGLGEINIGRFFILFWPLVIIAVGVSIIMNNRHRTLGIIIAGVGLAMLLSDVFGFNVWGILWPMMIIYFGVRILMDNGENRDFSNVSANMVDSDRLNELVLFWGSEKRIVSKSFMGGSSTVIFGGIDLDLRDVELPQSGAQLNIFCAFGGVEIRVSSNYRVKTNGSAIFGGWDNHYAVVNDDNKPILYITGTATFGGVEIKN